MFTKFSLFAKTKSLENKIDVMHDKIIDANMIFAKYIRYFLENRPKEDQKKLCSEIYDIESKNDSFRREIENELYTRNLIPDLRSNVMVIIESIDKVLNAFEKISGDLYIENPVFPEEYNSQIRDLTQHVTECVENMVIASRAYFRNFNIVKDYSRKVYFLETEADKTLRSLKKEIFSNKKLSLAEKLHISRFLSDISDIANLSEDCIDWLMIFAIKRVI